MQKSNRTKLGFLFLIAYLLIFSFFAPLALKIEVDAMLARVAHQVGGSGEENIQIMNEGLRIKNLLDRMKFFSLLSVLGTTIIFIKCYYQRSQTK